MPRKRKSFKQLTLEFQRALLRKELARHGGNQHATAQTLGMSYREIRYQIQRLGLRRSPNRLKDLTRE